MKLAVLCAAFATALAVLQPSLGGVAYAASAGPKACRGIVEFVRAPLAEDDTRVAVLGRADSRPETLEPAPREGEVDDVALPALFAAMVAFPKDAAAGDVYESVYQATHYVSGARIAVQLSECLSKAPGFRKADEMVDGPLYSGRFHDRLSRRYVRIEASPRACRHWAGARDRSYSDFGDPEGPCLSVVVTGEAASRR